MSEKNGSGHSSPDPDVLREEIRQTRADLGETVQALAARADVKARAKEQVEQTKQRVRQSAVQATERLKGQATQVVHSAVASAEDASQHARRNPIPWASVAAAGVALVVVLLVVRSRRR